MASLDLHGFESPVQQYEGVYQAANTLERRRTHDEELGMKREVRRNSAATFLTNVLDSKDYLTGTPTDPILTQQLNGAMQQGLELALKGADNASIMQALSPVVGKISAYSQNAKLVNQNIKDQLGKLKGFKGYNLEALEQEAKKKAFYDVDTSGNTVLKDPSRIDPNGNWIGQAIESDPDKVTTSAGLDDFANNAPTNKTLSDITSYTPEGAMSKNKVHLIGQNYLVPDVDKKGATTGLVPQFDTAHDGGQPIVHTFTDAKGNKTDAPVRLLNEGVFDNMLQRDPSIADHIKGLVKAHIGEYKDEDGKSLDLGSPKAKLIARAIAYDELNRRKKSSIEQAQIADKPSPAQVHVQVYGNKEEEYRARQKGMEEGRQDVLGDENTRAFNRASGTATGQQSVLGGDSARAAERTKGRLSATKAATGTPEPDRIARFEKNGDPKTVSNLEGTTLSNGAVLKKVAKTSMMNLINDYYIEVEKDGKTEEVKFKNKKELADYLKTNTAATPAASTAKPEDLRKKYNY